MSSHDCLKIWNEIFTDDISIGTETCFPYFYYLLLHELWCSKNEFKFTLFQLKCSFANVASKTCNRNCLGVQIFYLPLYRFVVFKSTSQIINALWYRATKLCVIVHFVAMNVKCNLQIELGQINTELTSVMFVTKLRLWMYSKKKYEYQNIVLFHSWTYKKVIRL